MSLRLSALGYRYPSSAAPAVADVTLTVAPGEVVLLTGPTGCGKSTLLRLAAGLLQRHGQGARSGEVTVGGLDPADLAPAARVRALGFVAQEPGDQIVSGTVGDELAFAMESAGFAPAAMEARIPALLQAVGLDVAPDRPTTALSGGQTQRLVTGAALAAGADALLLDEPLAQLDPAGAAALLARLRALAAGGVAVLLVEHRLEACAPFVDRVVVMEAGRLVADAPAAELRPGAPLVGVLRRLGLSVPERVALEEDLGGPLAQARFEVVAPEPSPPGPEVARWGALRHRYDGADRDALGLPALALGRGERVALVGANGAGKSTLLALLAGWLPGAPPPGGRVVAVPQDPDLALFCPTVADELAYGPRELGRPDVAAAVAEAAAALSVAELLARPPQALSRGQRLRVAVAAALACAPDLLLLDEPTSGQDRDQVERMMRALRASLADGALVFATHDLSLALRHATRVLVLHDGGVVADGPPQRALADLPAALPLPPLAALCRERGLPLVDAETLRAGVRP